MTKTINRSMLRSMVRVLLEDKSLGPAMLKVNPVVDPSAAVTDPANPDFVPLSPAELKVALSAMVDNVPQDNIPDIYKSMKNALDVPGEDEGTEEDMKKDTKTEAAIRRAVRKMIREGSYADLASTGLGGHIGSAGGSQEMGLEDIASKIPGLGGPSAVQNMIDRLLPRLKNRIMNRDQVTLIALETMDKYITDLVDNEEISPKEGEWWRNHPEIVENDTGFRTLLNKALMKAGM